MNRLSTLVEALGISGALENGTYDDEDTAGQRFAHTKTINNSRYAQHLHEVIQTIA